jgi:hypothetical protein
MTSDGENEVSTSSSDDLVGVIDWQDVSVVCKVQEPILVLVIKLLSNVGSLDLCNLVADSSRVSLRILAINCIHDFDINLDGFVKEATWLNNHVVLEKVS